MDTWWRESGNELVVSPSICGNRNGELDVTPVTLGLKWLMLFPLWFFVLAKNNE